MYRAWDPEVRRDVAIKVLTSVHDPGMVARFRSEPGTTGILKHRNIVTIYDFGEHESAPYLVMELLEGRTLQQAIETGPPLSLLVKVAVLVEVAEGLLHAHESGVIHRDIKPANIMLLADGAVKVLDFGIARMADPNLTRQTSTGMMIGTAEYMAPEQFEGKDATALSDIFSYGVVCYELISGKQPFRASNWMAAALLIANAVPEPLPALAPECPEALDAIVRKAVAKRPSERYQSLQDMLFDLAPIKAGLRKIRADALAVEGQRALNAGDLNAAEQEARRALELDPAHSPSQELRRRIQRQRERLALAERFKKGMEEADSLLQSKSFDEGIQTLEAMRGWLVADSVADLRRNLEVRLTTARKAREKSRRIVPPPPAAPLSPVGEFGVQPQGRPWRTPVLTAVAIVAFGGLAYVAIQRFAANKQSLQPSPVGNTDVARLRDKNWAQARFDDPDFSNCMDVPLCLTAKQMAQALQAKDWKSVRYDDPEFSNCMGFQPCTDRHKQAERLLAVADWPNLIGSDRQLLNDCMGYSKCLAAKLAVVPPPPKPEGGELNYARISCCSAAFKDDKAKYQACRKYKMENGLIQGDCFQTFQKE